VVRTKDKESSSDPSKDLTKLIKSMEANHASQLNSMHNRLIYMETSYTNRFHPRKNERWQRKGPPQDQRPPNQLEATICLSTRLHLFVGLVMISMKNLLVLVSIRLMKKGLQKKIIL
jgi:hypothetical protein